MSSTAFRASLYEYKITFGTVMDRKSVSWSHTVRCETFEDVIMLCEMWRETRDDPAFEVEIDYIPNRYPDGDDA